MKQQYIYLVFTKTGTWLSRTLNFFENSDYIHVSLGLDNPLNNLYSFGRTNPSNPFSGGFVVEDLSEGIYKRFEDTSLCIYRLKVTEKQYYILRKKISPFIISKHSYRYNFIGLFGLWFNLPVNRSFHFFCSQFVSLALTQAGIYRPKKAFGLIKPCDLLQIKALELVYKGTIKSYINEKSYAIEA